MAAEAASNFSLYTHFSGVAERSYYRKSTFIRSISRSRSAAQVENLVLRYVVVCQKLAGTKIFTEDLFSKFVSLLPSVNSQLVARRLLIHGLLAVSSPQLAAPGHRFFMALQEVFSTIYSQTPCALSPSLHGLGAIIGWLQFQLLLRAKWFGGARQLRVAKRLSRTLQPDVLRSFADFSIGETQTTWWHNYFNDSLRTLLCTSEDLGCVYLLTCGCEYVGQATSQRGQKRHGASGGLVYRYLEHTKCLIKRLNGTQPRDEDRYTWLSRSRSTCLALNIVRTVHITTLDVWEKATIQLQNSAANQTIGSSLKTRTAKLFKMRAALIQRVRPNMTTRKRKQYLYMAAATQSTAQDGGNHQLQRLATSIGKQQHGEAVHKQRLREQMTLFAMPYSQAYLVYRQRQLGPCSGPADITSPRNVWHLLRYLGENELWVPWQALVTASSLGPDYVYWLLFRASRLSRLQIRARVIDAVEGSLQYNSLPILQDIYVLAPTRSSQVALTRHMSKLVWTVSRWYPNLASQLRLFTKIGITKRVTWGQLLPNSSVRMRNFNPLSLLSSTPEQRHMWEHGYDMERLPVASCVPLPTDCSVLLKQSRDSFNRWRRLCIPPALQFVISAAPPPLPSIRTLECPGQGEPLLQPAQLYFLLAQRRDLVVAQEDKDSSILWLMSASGLAWRWIRQLVLAPDRWSLITSPLAPVVRLFQLAFDVSMPGNLQRQFSGKTCVSRRNLPTCKPLVKRKCWLSGTQVMHVCSKPGHSCFRNVISFFHLPQKVRFRYASRGLQVLIQRYFQNVEIRGLARATHMVKSGLHKLRVDHSLPRQCRVCRVQLLRPSLLALDADQAFEAMKPERVRHAMHMLCRLVRRVQHAPTVTIRHISRTSGMLGGEVRIQNKATSTYTLHTLQRSIEACLTMRYYDFMKDTVLYQVSGAHWRPHDKNYVVITSMSRRASFRSHGLAAVLEAV